MSTNTAALTRFRLEHGNYRGFMDVAADGMWCRFPDVAALIAQLEAQAEQVAPDAILAARAEGRAEAVQMIMGMEPEDALSDCTVCTGPCPSGEYDTDWDEAKLREKFNAGDKLFNMETRMEMAYWDYQEARMVIQYEAEQRRAAQSSSQTSAPVAGMGEPIKTWQERTSARAMCLPLVEAMQAEIADLRAALASASAQQAPAASLEPVSQYTNKLIGRVAEFGFKGGHIEALESHLSALAAPAVGIAKQFTGMRCTICCAKAGDPHVLGCSEAPVPPIAVQNAMMALDAERARRWLERGPDRRQQQTEMVPNLRAGVDRRSR